MIGRHLLGRQVAVAILIIVFLVSIVLAASAGPLRAQNSDTVASAALPLTNRHLVGSISSISPDQKSFILTLKSGHAVTVKLSHTTDLLELSPTKKTITLADLHSGSRVAVAIVKNPTDLVQARLVVLLPSNNPSYRIVHGTVTDLSTNTFTLVLPGNKTLKVTLVPSTIYSKKDRHAPTLVQQSDLVQGSQVLVVGTLDGDTIAAKLIHIVKL